MKLGEILIDLNIDIIESIILSVFLIICTFTDIKNKTISIGVCIIFGTIGIIYESVFNEKSIIYMLSGIMPGVMLFIVSIITKESIGRGDAIVIAIIGIYLGILKNFVLLIYTIYVTVIIGAVLLLILRKGKKYKIPFMPFILIGFIATII